jgi:hypothetical protein
MFTVTNKTEVNKAIQGNRLMFWIGVGCLFGSMTSLFIGGGSDPTTIFVFGYPMLFVGVVLTKRGAFNNRRHGQGGYRQPSEADIIENALSGVPPRYHLYNSMRIDKVVQDHLLVTSQGIILLMMKSQIGRLKAGRDLYRMKKGVLNWIGTLGEPSIGNPSRELGIEVKRVRKWFEKQGYEVPVDGIVCLYNPRAEIESVADMSFPVCTVKDLRQAVRQWETELNMTADEQREIEKLLVDTLPEPQKTEVNELLDMSPTKRASVLQAQEREKAELMAAKNAKRADKKRRPASAPAPKSAGTVSPLTGQRLGLNGKPLEEKEVARPKIRRVKSAPLRKPNPGAFGEDRKK